MVNSIKSAFIFVLLRVFLLCVFALIVAFFVFFCVFAFVVSFFCVYFWLFVFFCVFWALPKLCRACDSVLCMWLPRLRASLLQKARRLLPQVLPRRRQRECTANPCVTHEQQKKETTTKKQQKSNRWKQNKQNKNKTTYKRQNKATFD